MMTGRVVGHEPRVNVVFRLPNRPDFALEFVVDTGFEGALTLPHEAVDALGLPFFQEIISNLADDTSVRTNVHIGVILWSSEPLEVAVLAMGKRPLLGAALLADKRLTIDYAENGPVMIEDL